MKRLVLVILYVTLSTQIITDPTPSVPGSYLDKLMTTRYPDWIYWDDKDKAAVLLMFERYPYKEHWFNTY